LQRRKTRTRRPELIAALAAAVCLAGCGSGPTPRAAPPPKLPAGVATSLAARSDEVAQALAEGNACRASSLASAANDLVSRIRCIPPAQPHERGKHKGREKKKKHNEEND
jgi:hypothetical protein